MRPKIFYNKICPVCNQEFTATQSNAKTCSDKCRNILSLARKYGGANDVITPVDTPVITSKSKRISAQKVESNLKENNCVNIPQENVLTWEENISINNVKKNVLTTDVLARELEGQNIHSLKGDIFCSLFYKYISNLINNSKEKNTVEIPSNKLKDFGFHLKKLPAKITIGDFVLRLKVDIFTIIFPGPNTYTVLKNKELSALLEGYLQ